MAFSQVRRGCALFFPSPALLGGNQFVCLRRFFRRATELCATPIVLLLASDERCPLDSHRRNVACRLPNRGEPLLCIRSSLTPWMRSFSFFFSFRTKNELLFFFSVLTLCLWYLLEAIHPRLTLTPQCPSVADRASSRLGISCSAAELKVVQLCRFNALRSKPLLRSAPRRFYSQRTPADGWSLNGSQHVWRSQAHSKTFA